MRIRPVALFAFTAASLLAQAPSPVADARALWKDASDYVVQSAVDFPEAKYGFNPTPEVRSFGELIANVAGAQHMFCAIALGEKPPAEDAVEKSARTKAALIAAMRESNMYCARAYAQAK